LKMEMPLDFQRRGGGGKMRRVGNVGVCIANKKQRKKTFLHTPKLNIHRLTHKIHSPQPKVHQQVSAGLVLITMATQK